MSAHKGNLTEAHRRRIRKERHARLGAGSPEGRNILSAGAAIPNPLTPAESLDRGAIVFQIEFFEGVYPNGIVYKNAAHNVEFTTAGELKLNSVGVNILFDMTANTPANGIHTIVSYVDVPSNLAILHLDGLEIGREESGGFTNFAGDPGTWDYLNVTTDFGFASDLEVFPGFRLATLLG